MLQALQVFFEATGFVPHGYSMLWRPDLIALHVASDSIAVIAYFTIPLALYRILRDRRESSYFWVGVLFAAFIFFCAFTQLFGMLTLWFPVYAQQGLVKAGCAMVSALTAIRIWQLVPTLRQMPSPEEVERKNAELVAEMELRRSAEADLHTADEALRLANQDLESRVAQRTEELERANTELERYAYAASHDLRAPVRALTSLPVWIRESLVELYGSVDVEVDIDLDEMESQSHRMDRLLTDLLEYARIGVGDDLKQTLEPAGLIQEAIKLSGVSDGFTVDVAEDLPPIYCVPAEFSLVMRNLIGNAVKHHDRTSGRITISARQIDDFTVFRVADDGPGIPHRFASQIFDLFTNLKPRDEVEGSGLGLAMVKKMIEGLGGQVRLLPSEGRGATFELSFPREGANTCSTRSQHKNGPGVSAESEPSRQRATACTYCWPKTWDSTPETSAASCADGQCPMQSAW